MALIVLVAGTSISGLTAILFIVSVATTYWATANIRDCKQDDVHFGLFKISLPNGTESYKTVPGSLMFVQAMEVIAVLGSMALAGFGAVVLLCKYKEKSLVQYAACAEGIVDIIMLMSGTGSLVFAYKAYTDVTITYPLDNGTMGFSYYLSLGALVLGTIAGYLIKKGGKDLAAKEEAQEMQ